MSTFQSLDLVSPNDFTDLDVIENCLAGFEARYNDTAQTFTWKFTTTDPADLLERLEHREQRRPLNPHQDQAA